MNSWKYKVRISAICLKINLHVKCKHCWIHSMPAAHTISFNSRICLWKTLQILCSNLLALGSCRLIFQLWAELLGVHIPFGQGEEFLLHALN